MGLFNWLRGPHQKRDDVSHTFQRVSAEIFPRGERDIQEMVSAIQIALPGKLTPLRAREIGTRLRFLAHTAADGSQDRLMSHLQPHTADLTDEERYSLISAILPLADRRSQKKDGATIERAIVIDAENSFEGIDAEYQMLDELFGPQNRGWTLIKRGHSSQGQRVYDWFHLQLSDGGTREIYFDITSFYGK